VIRVAVGIALLSCLLAGCSGDDPESATTTATQTTSTTTGSTTSQLLGPDETFARFLRAASRRDVARTWALLSPGSRRRLGPTLPAFRADGSRTLARETRGFRDGFRVVVAGRIAERWGLAAATKGAAAYGSALRLDRRRWTVELGGPVRIESVRPEPGERVSGRTQIAAEVKARAAIEDAGLWLNGSALPARGGGLTPKALTMFADSGHLASGRHSAVAFAATAGGAAVLAWTFTSRGRSGGSEPPPPIGPA
jgi:hypothetical protein